MKVRKAGICILLLCFLGVCSGCQKPPQEVQERMDSYGANSQMESQEIEFYTLEELKQEQQQAIEARRQRLEAAGEAARRAAEEKLHALYARQDFFERRMLRSFPTMKSARHPEALTKLKEYLSNRKK